MFTVRVVAATDPQKPVNSREHKFDTKQQALEFISRLGHLSSIWKHRERKTYVVTPAARS